MIHQLLTCRFAGTEVLVITAMVLVELPRNGTLGLANVTLFFPSEASVLTMGKGAEEEHLVSPISEKLETHPPGPEPHCDLPKSHASSTGRCNTI
jgi:hypothetical protein